MDNQRGRTRPVSVESLEGRLLFSTWIDTGNRAAVAQLYQTQYLGSANIDPGWTGSYQTGDAGTTTAAFRQRVLNRINYYRSMVGEDNVTSFDPTWNAKDQQAAFMMSANNDLNHTPPNTWKYYTADGADAAGKSNLALGAYGSDAIDLYVDETAFDYVPHRRGILYPQTTVMATGDVPAGSWQSNGQTINSPGANALYTVTSQYFDPRPATREAYVAWPAPGYDPYQTLPQLWSFAYTGANFSQAQVSVTRNGAPVQVSQKPFVDYFDSTLTWGIADAADATEKTYVVHVNNVVINGAAKDFTYNVTSFDPTAVSAPALLSTTAGTAADTTQRTLVKQVSFTFDRPVTVAAGAVSLVRLNTGGSGSNNGAAPTDVSGVLSAPTSSNGGATWTYTFSGAGTTNGSLDDGIYTATLDASKVSANGTAMVGPNPATTFHRLFGDVNGNKTVNTQDYGLFRNAFGKSAGQAGFDAAFDFDNNGIVNTADYGQFRNRFGKVFGY